MNPQHESPPGGWEVLALGKALVWFGDVGMSSKCPGTKFQLERGGPLLVSLPLKFRAGWSRCSREEESRCSREEEQDQEPGMLLVPMGGDFG